MNKLRINQQSLAPNKFKGQPTSLLRLQYDKNGFKTPHHCDSALHNPYKSRNHTWLTNSTLFTNSNVTPFGTLTSLRQVPRKCSLGSGGT